MAALCCDDDVERRSGRGASLGSLELDGYDPGREPAARRERSFPLTAVAPRRRDRYRQRQGDPRLAALWPREHSTPSRSVPATVQLLGATPVVRPEAGEGRVACRASRLSRPFAAGDSSPLGYAGPPAHAGTGRARRPRDLHQDRGSRSSALLLQDHVGPRARRRRAVARWVAREG